SIHFEVNFDAPRAALNFSFAHRRGHELRSLHINLRRRAVAIIDGLNLMRDRAGSRFGSSLRDSARILRGHDRDRKAKRQSKTDEWFHKPSPKESCGETGEGANSPNAWYAQELQQRTSPEYKH